MNARVRGGASTSPFFGALIEGIYHWIIKGGHLPDFLFDLDDREVDDDDEEEVEEVDQESAPAAWWEG